MLTSLEYYRIFYYVAKYRNFTRAADVLLTSQPTVTRTIKNLESDLGCRLFVRGKRGVTLTTEGELLYSYIAPAYEKILKGEEKLGGETSLQGGSVYVSATETSLHWFPFGKIGIVSRSSPANQVKDYQRFHDAGDRKRLSAAVRILRLSLLPPRHRLRSNKWSFILFGTFSSATPTISN